MIRKYRTDDLSVVYNIWLEASSLAHPFLPAEFSEQVKHDMLNIYIPNGETWVYEEGGEIIGFIGMIENEIGGLFVLPVHHSKGIGSKLVNFMLQYHPVLEVEVFEKNQIGKAFYSKYGFEQFKQYFHEPSQCEVIRLRFTQ